MNLTSSIFASMLVAASVCHGIEPDVFLRYVSDNGSGASTQPYIKTGIAAKSGLAAEIVLKCTTTDKDRAVVGARIDSDNQLIFLWQSSTSFSCRYGSASCPVEGLTVSSKTIYRVYTELLPGHQSITVKNELTGALLGSAEMAEQGALDIGKDIWLFRYNNNGSVGGSTQKNIYSYKVWEIGTTGEKTLVQDLRPAMVDGKAGMWDAVTQEMLYSSAKDSAFGLGYKSCYLSPTGNDENDGHTRDTPVASLARAKEIAPKEGGELVFADGTYELDGPIANLSVRSLSGNREACILDFKGASQGVAITGSGIGPASVRDVTISNCLATANGAGVSMVGFDKERFSVSNCKITDCIATSAGANRSGGGIYAESVRIENCEIRNCEARSTDTSADKDPTVTGGGVSAKDSELMNIQITDCGVYLTGSSAIYPEGGGLALQGDSMLSNSNLRANWSTGRGAGLFLDNDAGESLSVVDTAIVGNRIVVRDEKTVNRTGGAGMSASCSGCASVRNCNISDNEIDDPNCNSERKGGAAFYLNGAADFEIVSSVVTNNSTVGRAAIAYFASSVGDCVISNCVFAGNSAALDATIYAYGKPNVLFADCAFTGNSCGQYGLLWWNLNSTDALDGIRFRNSLFTRNVMTREGTCRGFRFENFSGHSAPVVFEQCTLVNEEAPNATGGLLFGDASSAASSNYANIHLRGSVIYGDADHPWCKLGSVMAQNRNIVYSAGQGVPTDDDLHNVDLSVKSPRFNDLARGDYRPKRSSPLVNAGGPLQPWMGSGAADGVLDRGDCTVGLVSSGIYGLVPNWNNQVPRVLDGAVDIGCCECNFPPLGMMLILR